MLNINDERVNFILLQSKGRSVLHVGCSDWPYTERRIKEGRLLHQKLVDVCENVIGVDITQSRIDDIQKHFVDNEFVLYDKLEETSLGFELIVAGEVIEHVENPAEFLLSLRQISKESTKILLTTPNAQSVKSALRALFGREYSHPDHVVLFSTKTLSTLLGRTGWRVDKVSYYMAKPTTLLGKISSIPFKFLRLIFSDRIGDGLMIVASSDEILT